MGKYTIYYLFENPRRGMQARKFTTNVPKILDLKSSSEQIFFRKLSLGAPDFFSFEISLYFSKYFSLHLFIFILLRSPLITFKLKLDCEQSLFSFRVSESNARARERRSGKTRETRAASPVSRHQSRA